MVELHLAQDWALTIGEDSKSFMSALGGPAADVQTVAWAHEHGSPFKALGHILDENDSIQPCVTSTVASMWRSFYSNLVIVI